MTELRRGMDKKVVLKELKFQAIRSGGPGGQHVNKVSSKVVLFFDILASAGLTSSEKERILQKVSKRLNKQGILVLQCDETRSQHKNKETLIKRFLDLIQKSVQVAKPRKRTQPSKSSIERRLQSKKMKARKKESRKPPEF